MATSRPRPANIPQPADDALIEFKGRSYSRFSLQAKTHCVPVDEAQERLEDELNRTVREVLTTIVPRDFTVGSSREVTILDCGYGKGAWIDAILDEYEDAVVTGIDTFLGRGNGDDSESSGEDGNGGSSDTAYIDTFIRKRWNLNSSFRDDRSESRLLPDTFDLVNSRFLTDGINGSRWESYVRELKLLLKPGGWLQMVELDLNVQSTNGTLRGDSYLRRWWERYTAALTRLGKDPRVGGQLERHARRARMSEIEAVVKELPVGGWSERAGRAELGRQFRDNVLKPLLDAVSLWPLSGRIGESTALMDEDSYVELMNGVRRELDDDSLRLFVRLFVRPTAGSASRFADRSRRHCVQARRPA